MYVVLCKVSVTWNNCWGIGIQELHDHAECHSAFNTTSKWILLDIDFYDIFLYFYVPGLKGPPGASSNQIVRLSVRLSVRPSVRPPVCL